MLRYFYQACLLTLLSNCHTDQPKPLKIPNSYNRDAYLEVSIPEYEIRSQLNLLIKEAQKGRTEGVSVSANTLRQLFSAQPNLQSATSAYYAALLTQPNGIFDQLAESSGATYTPGPPNNQGGTFGGYLFNAYGLEPEQLLDKGLYAALLYKVALNILQDTRDEKSSHRLLAIYGGHPDFPNTPTLGKAANPDKFVANYAARRDKNDGQGYYSQIQKALITFQAACAAGPDYLEEQEEAAARFCLLWEKINFATVVNYCHAVNGFMSQTNPTDSDKAKALHALSECIGFTHGWKNLPQPTRQITDSDIDQILELLNAPANGVPSCWKFTTEPITELPKLNQIIALVQAKYGFTNQEIEDFKNNWVTIQGR